MTSYLMFDVYLRNYICFSNVIQEEGDMYEIMIHTNDTYIISSCIYCYNAAIC